VGTGRWVRGYLARARRDETERFGLEVFLRSLQVSHHFFSSIMRCGVTDDV
jgi:hypothetical protein